MAQLRRISRALGALILTGALAACGTTTGSGNIVTEGRDVEAFEFIDVSAGIRVELRVEPSAAHAVTVNYDDNIIDKVVTHVSNNRLRVQFDGSVRLSGGSGRSVVVIMPVLRGMEASGGATITASGASDGFYIDASGGATVDADDLQAFNVTVDASGGATVDLFATGSVTGDASGGASIHVAGPPGVLDIDTSGGASVSTD